MSTFRESGRSHLHKIILVIHSNDLKTANQFCNDIGAVGQTFINPLFFESEIVGYWCGWNVSDEQLESIYSMDHIFEIYNSRSEALKLTGWNVAQTDQERQKADEAFEVLQSE